MNSQKLNDWLQIVGLFGVIGSLVFVGLQVKQTQAIALSENYQNRLAAGVDLNVGLINSADFLSGVSKVYRDSASELTMQEAVALEWYFGSDLMIVENNHLQYQSGFLPTQKIAGKATGTFPCNDKQSASSGQQTLASPPAP